MKSCISCGTSKPLSDFYEHFGMSDGRLGKCKDCCKKYNSELKRYWKHSIDREMFDWLAFDYQNGMCALCLGELSTSSHLDHDHHCEKRGEHFGRDTKYSQEYGCPFCIRGVLCGSCNRFRIPGIEFLADKGLFRLPYLDLRPLLIKIKSYTPKLERIGPGKASLADGRLFKSIHKRHHTLKGITKEGCRFCELEKTL